MKTKTVTIFTIAIVFALLTGCTDNTATHNYGGTEEIALPAGQHFVDAYWDAGDHLWYTTRPMTATDQPTTYTMKERSNFASMQGTVIFKGTK